MYGLPRSGKSTIARQLAKEFHAPIVNQDNIRLALHGQVYAKEAEPMVRALYRVMIHSLFLSGHGTVIADETHWSREKRDFVREGPWKTYFYEVPTPAATCLQRAHDTNQPWLFDVIKEMVKRTDPLDADELIYRGYRENTTGKDCYECHLFDAGWPPSTDRIIYHENNHVWPGFAGETR